MFDSNFTRSDDAEAAFDLFYQNIGICDYYDPDTIPSFDLLKNRFFALHVNIRSSTKHLDDLHELLTQLHNAPNAICVSETRLNETFDTRLVILDGYEFIDHNSRSKAGGVAMYIAENLDFEIVDKYSINLDGCKNLWIKLRINNCETFIVCVICTHPKSNVESFIDKLELSLEKISRDVPSRARVRVLSRVIRHYSYSAEFAY